jgi:hypothetical protein
MSSSDPSGLQQELYNELAYYTLAHSDPSFIHQHIVDAYAAQYADETTKPIKLTFALVGLYLYVEKHWSGRAVQEAHMRLASRRKQWPRFDLPEQRGAVTVSDVVAAPPGRERDEAIRKWCISVWEAYRDTHQQVADLVQVELPGFRA